MEQSCSICKWFRWNSEDEIYCGKKEIDEDTMILHDRMRDSGVMGPCEFFVQIPMEDILMVQSIVNAFISDYEQPNRN